MHTMICTQQHSSLVQHRGRAACPPSQHQVQLQQCRTIMACTFSRSSMCTAPQCQQHVTSHSRRLPPLQAAPDWDFDFDKNPQNTQNPQVVPSPSLSALEAVRVQLQAISNNDQPWDNHGVQTMYEFAEDSGSMERSRYFGFSKDLYHLDHFLGGFKTACGALVDCQSFTILEGPPESPDKPITPLSEGMEAVYVAVTDSKGGGGGVFELRLVQRGFGLKAGCWMTKSCLKVK